MCDNFSLTFSDRLINYVGEKKRENIRTVATNVNVAVNLVPHAVKMTEGEGSRKGLSIQSEI